jgi:hypothetical protein
VNERRQGNAQRTKQCGDAAAVFPAYAANRDCRNKISGVSAITEPLTKTGLSDDKWNSRNRPHRCSVIVDEATY